VGNVEEEANRHSDEARKGKGFKGGRMYDIQECIFHFTAKTIVAALCAETPTLFFLKMELLICGFLFRLHLFWWK
jgi:hypothetical protein